MKTPLRMHLSIFAKTLLACAALGIWCLPVSAQGAAGGTAGGGTTGGGTVSGGASSAGGSNSGAPGGVGGNSSGGFGTSATTGDVFGMQGSGSTNYTGANGTSSISQMNPFYNYYASPLAAGFSGNVNLVSQNSFGLTSTSSGSASGTLVTGKGTFGTAMANITTTGKAGGGGGGGGASANIGGFTTIGIKRTPSYYTTVDANMIPVRPASAMPALQEDLRTALRSSTSTLPSGQNLDVVLDNGVFVLQGTVRTERERRIAEGLVRTTPGVSNVRNDIQVAGTNR
jgi:hypothetical protein